MIHSVFCILSTLLFVDDSLTISNMSKNRQVSAIEGWADKFLEWHIHLYSELLIHM